MSGEGSSSVTGKKKLPTRKRKEIEYADDEERPLPDAEPIPEDDRDLKSHTLLRFMSGGPEYSKMEKFVQLELLEHKTFDWQLIDRLGQKERIETMLGPRWLDALACKEHQYAELTVEFHSTVMYAADRFVEPYAISFALGRKLWKMSVKDFAVYTGLYTREETKTLTFQDALRGYSKKTRKHWISEGPLVEFWMRIADTAWSSQATESSIRDPIIRYLHRIIACTITGRKSSTDRVNITDLFCLYCIVENHEANLATVLLTSFTRGRRGGGVARLELGPYVTRLASRLGVFDWYPARLLTRGDDTATHEVLDLQKAGIVTWQEPLGWGVVKAGPQVPPPAGTLAREAMEMGVPPERQRTLPRSERPQRQYPLRERPSPPLTLEALRDQIFDRLDRQDAAIRHMMEQQDVDIPDYFLVRVDENQVVDAAEGE